MSYLRGPDRNQIQLLPPAVDDDVAANVPARFIDAYVEGLDFAALGFTRAQPGDTGRPPYHPGDLLKLYLYDYLHRVRSSRRLEAGAARHLERIWLLRGVRPDFKTIADFRKDHRAAFKPLFKNFNLLCRSLDLFGAELVAIDGSKFKAVANLRRCSSQEQLAERPGKIEARIEEYLSELDGQDAHAEGVPAAPGREELAEKIAQLQRRKGRCDALLAELQASGEEKIAVGDSSSRPMKGAHGEHFMGDNVQAAGDARHHLLASDDVVQDANDRGQLGPMVAAAKAELGVDQLQATADAGYHESDQLEACEAAGVETFVPEPRGPSGRGPGGRPVFSKEQFRYDAEADAYHCPGGAVLPRASMNQDHGKTRLLYYHRAACRQCPLHSQCITAPWRVVARRVNEAVVERAAARVAAQPEIVARRKTIIEHVFGTLRLWGQDRFLMRGLEKVRAEFSLSALTCNLRRALNLRSLDPLLAALGRPAAA